MDKFRNPKIWILIVSVFVALIAIREFTQEKKQITLEDETKRRAGPCPGETKKISLEGHFYELTVNWYECHPLKAGEWVYYRYSFSKDAVPRMVVAVAGDKILLKKDADKKRWNLFVNEKMATSSKKLPYEFGNADRDPVLALYEKQNNGILKTREAVVFSDPDAGSLDSGLFGVVNIDDFLGKLEPLEK